MFPVSSLWVAFVHFVPQVVVLILGALIAGWRPTFFGLAMGVLSVLVVGVFALGLGLAFAAWNVMFRDAENLVDLIAMVAIWVSPVFYNWTMVRGVLPDWLWFIYQMNPLAVSVELSHYAFWVPTRGVVAEGATAASMMPEHWVWAALIGAIVAGLTLLFGQWVFHRSEGSFAQEL